MSTSPECHRSLRGRSPAFAALTSTFEKPSTRNLSTPPPAVKKLFPKSAGPDTSKQSAISDLTSSLKSTIPKSAKDKAIQEEDGMGGDDETEDDEGRTIYPYERVNTTSEDPAPDIDLTKREIYLSTAEFSDKFGMTRAAFYKLPKWKQNKLKTVLQLF